PIAPTSIVCLCEVGAANIRMTARGSPWTPRYNLINVRKLARYFTVCNVLCGALFAFYTICFWHNLSGRWFDPSVTTDDAFPQVFQFHAVYHPGIFDNDLITEMMRCYLTPLHYALCYAITWLTGDPIMMAHWVMFIQLALTLLFIFLAVRHAASAAP